MKIQFYAKNIELTPGLKQVFEEKLEHLKKYKGKLKLLDVRVDLSRDNHHRKGDVFRVEVNVDLPGQVLRVVETGADMISTLDVAARKLERQARDVKERLVGQSKQR
ncbi:MAG: ribosomal subunit interface protein [Candidatus Komeilibacteria bacterium RIFCSPLOWO2_02_FULL_48_11]|uniref:Ribosomal subunit interface protein n=1 Tax=Candidatus Komeilibacteria bacterium RIFCSPLOWO2_02_FULL_48_11 TaxID=1798553 RepID=A0A1G2BQU1_9BACT|nr:MAG: ribosomal subunit interface protein [Candidatus Komeilibacteria bacterium RIFCSPLOWO2_02_FULL_48_11]